MLNSLYHIDSVHLKVRRQRRGRARRQRRGKPAQRSKEELRSREKGRRMQSLGLATSAAVQSVQVSIALMSMNVTDACLFFSAVEQLDRFRVEKANISEHLSSTLQDIIKDERKQRSAELLMTELR